jgi:hypothetical protein
MSFLRHIRACNTHDPDAFRPFLIGDARIGSVRHAFAERLAGFPAVFAVAPAAVRLAPGLDGFEARSEAMAEVVGRLVEAGDIPRLKRETYPVSPHWGAPPLMAMDRGAVPVFGVTAFGIHVNGFVRTAAGLEMWVGRRSTDRRVAPGKLDNLVGGGQPLGMSLRDNLAKEGAEEAGLTPEQAAAAVAVGAVTYAMDTPAGVKRDVLFNYDLELDPGFVPRNTDGEVAEFHRWPVAEVAARVHDSDDFKFNVNLVVIDFLIRHGVLTPDDPDYLTILAGLRQ